MENSKAIVRSLSKLSFQRLRILLPIPPPHARERIKLDGDESPMNADSEVQKRTRCAKMSTTMFVHARYGSLGPPGRKAFV
jgi:hypothetical protein